MSEAELPVTPELVLRAYAAGVFPMARSRHDPHLEWFEPVKRGIIPLDAFHLPRSLRKVIRRGRFEVTVDRDFRAVIEGCAEAVPNRDSTWISDRIIDIYCALHRQGHAHSVETRFEGRLAGGLYGLAIGGAFFGESMFSRMTDASKVALVHLVARLRTGGFTLLDCQFQTEHLARFGTVEITRLAYRRALAAAVQAKADFGAAPADVLAALH